ncbi:thiolase family protein [Bordetella sp. 15P40C-2]|uniref:thiolase family protein n=1 Tax=Bordetella sp. 15P40C-2 TaxID=2572246 RepID=UPI001328E733|nr:thiolase family protein [Bordetella sp. 15P40C-2]MVW70330.1 acetyl-CoA C-acyltransferase [Bordetella sp. 15P40C-2]
MTQTRGAIRIGCPDREVVVCAFARSPFGRFGGVLSPLTLPDLGAQVINALLTKSGIPAADIGAAYCGIGLAGAAALTVTRQTVLRSVLAQELPSVGIDRACCSGMTAIAQAARDIMLGLQDVAIAGGMESLSNMPMYLPRQRSIRPGSVQLKDPLILGGDAVDRPIAVYSGEEAERFGVDRSQQDAWAAQSHQRYFEALEQGAFAKEIVPVEVANGPEVTRVTADEGPRPDTTPSKLARLKTVYGSPTITAGNAPGLSDGAAFLVLSTRAFATQRGWPVLGHITSYAQAAGGPTSGTSLPATAIERLLAIEGADILDFDRIEINEAYAATALVSTQVLSQGSQADLATIRSRTNPWGGAVAIGHPLGASGARLVMTLLSGFEKAGKKQRGIAAICGGFGQSDALVVESA